MNYHLGLDATSYIIAYLLCTPIYTKIYNKPNYTSVHIIIYKNSAVKHFFVSFLKKLKYLFLCIFNEKIFSFSVKMHKGKIWNILYEQLLTPLYIVLMPDF